MWHSKGTKGVLKGNVHTIKSSLDILYCGSFPLFVFCFVFGGEEYLFLFIFHVMGEAIAQ